MGSISERRAQIDAERDQIRGELPLTWFEEVCAAACFLGSMAGIRSVFPSVPLWVIALVLTPLYFVAASLYASRFRPVYGPRLRRQASGSSELLRRSRWAVQGLLAGPWS